MSVASLPMYWRAENAHLWQAFWSVFQDCAAKEGLTAPDLTPPDALPASWADHWQDPDLFVSMTCGLPFRTALRNKVQYVGTFDFALNTQPGHYMSCVIRRSCPNGASPVADMSGLRLAYNAPDSQSGWAVTQLAAPFEHPPRFADICETGSHAQSLAAVAQGAADIAYIDAVSWRILQRFDPNAAKVHLVGHSAVTPGLPLITARGTDPAPLRRALHAATRAYSPQTPDDMGGPMTFCVLDARLYHAQPSPAPPGA
ncbi:phosphate/phosphite/phosphonate ABC transporter substrate-binding protein [Marivita sp. S0852]|uniref:phosphate/phosphite/phosphonate ABC transporter substrate-binding protein n=1 Tax=Marivita sp. S0852 TaxID=3373893 RepID=UPI003982BEBD